MPHSVAKNEVLAHVVEFRVQGSREREKAGLVLGGRLDTLINTNLTLGEFEVAELRGDRRGGGARK